MLTLMLHSLMILILINTVHVSIVSSCYVMNDVLYVSSTHLQTYELWTQCGQTKSVQPYVLCCFWLQKRYKKVQKNSQNRKHILYHCILQPPTIWCCACHWERDMMWHSFGTMLLNWFILSHCLKRYVQEINRFLAITNCWIISNLERPLCLASAMFIACMQSNVTEGL